MQEIEALTMQEEEESPGEEEEGEEAEQSPDSMPS